MYSGGVTFTVATGHLIGWSMDVGMPFIFLLNMAVSNYG